jgi:hypothetical protein
MGMAGFSETSAIMYGIAEQVGSTGGASDLYSGGARIESRRGHAFTDWDVRGFTQFLHE